MFVMFGKQSCGTHQYVIGVSEDKAKLQSMIDQYDDATLSSSGKDLEFEDCPNEFAFGDFALKKKADDRSFVCDGIRIRWTDYLFLEETKSL